MNNWKQNDSIATLDSLIESKIDKYEYNLARYLNKYVDLRNYTEYDDWLGITPTSAFTQRPDLEDAPSINVIKSVIDSIVSKLSNNKTRPFFSPVNGNFKTRQVVRQAQQYFDQTYDQLHVHDIVSDAFKNACIFDIGYIFVDPFTYEVSCLPTWTIATLNAEAAYSAPTKMLIEMKNMPSMLLNKYGIKHDARYCNFEMFVDIIEKKATIFVNEQPVKTIKYDCDQLPIVRVYFNKPVYGNRTVSIADELEGLQTHIDLLSAKMSAAEQLTPANTIYVYNGTSNLHASDLSNKDGKVYELDMDPGMSKLPVEYVPRSPHDPIWQQQLEYYVQKAYDMIGISQLSSQSRKPSGLDSGVALQTMEDIESDRFETQVTHYTNAYVELALLMLKIMPDDAPILPTTAYNSSYTWKDIKEQQSLFKIQYSAASALSKDPAERLKQVLQLTQVGLIDPAKTAQYLDLPDLTDAYVGASAVSDAIDACIQRAIEKESYTIPDYINYQQLSQRIALVENQLYSSITGDDAKNDKEVVQSLARIMSLEQVLNAKMEDEGFLQLQQPEETATSDSGLAVGAQNAATQAISAADTMAKNTASVDQMNADQAATGLPINSANL
jgi:hypothetical protein